MKNSHLRLYALLILGIVLLGIRLFAPSFLGDIYLKIPESIRTVFEGNGDSDYDPKDKTESKEEDYFTVTLPIEYVEGPEEDGIAYNREENPKENELPMDNLE